MVAHMSCRNEVLIHRRFQRAMNMLAMWASSFGLMIDEAKCVVVNFTRSSLGAPTSKLPGQGPLMLEML